MRHAGLAGWRLPTLAGAVTLLAILAAGCDGGDAVNGTSNINPPSPRPSASVVLLAGNLGGPGTRDGIGSDARFHGPFGVAVDGTGRAYLTDGANHTVRRLSSGAEVVTLAGSRAAAGYRDGAGSEALFDRPRGIAVAPDGVLYVVDAWNNRVRRVTADGVVTTAAGSGVIGSADGPAATASFGFCTFVQWPFPPFDSRLQCADSGIAADSNGDLLVADSYNHTIRRISRAGLVSTVAGTTSLAGAVDGPALTAKFNHPLGVAVDAAGYIYVADTGNSVIRRISPGGEVATVAGLAGATGAVDGQGSAARFAGPMGIAVDSAGQIFVTDATAYTVRRITPQGMVTTVAGSPFLPGSEDGVGSEARFGSLASVAIDAGSNLYVADRQNHSIRRIAEDGRVTTMAGLAAGSGSTDAIGAAARFSSPSGVVVDRAGNVLVSDRGNHTIRRIAPSGAVSTFAGQPGVPGPTDGAGADARFASPADLAVDSNGNLYVADRFNHSIRRITPDGTVTTYAGLPGTPGATDGTRLGARFAEPRGLATDSGGNLYIADTGNHTIRKITSDGLVSTVAGSAGTPGSTDARGSDARFTSPQGLAVDRDGVIFVIDTGNNRIRRIAPTGDVSTVAGTGATGSGDGGAATATFALCTIRIIADPQSPERFRVCEGGGIAIDAAGNLYIADTFNQSIRRISPDGTVTTPFSFRSWYGYPPANLDYVLETPRDIFIDGSRLIVTAYDGVAAVLNLR